jgi:hypothetical protein
MAATLDLLTSPPPNPALLTGEYQPTTSPVLSSAIAFLRPVIPAPFDAIRQLFDHLRANPSCADALDGTYPARGISKTAAVENAISDQKLTIDLSAFRARLIPEGLRSSLAAHGLDEILSFFTTIAATHVPTTLSGLSEIVSVDFTSLHKSQNFNFRLCD